MKQCMDAPNLHRRLAKIIGQVQAIDRMIDEDVPCEDVLSQINAAKSALNKAGQVVLEGHIKHCVRDGIEHGNADETIEKFTKAVERFANMGSVKNFVALVKNGSFLVRIIDMTILIEKEFIYGSSKRPNPTDYYRKQHYQCG